MPIYTLTQQHLFPPVNKTHKSGILAVGGDLHPNRLLLAYQNGIFPWYNEDEEILWWSPNPRFVLFPTNLKVSKSMQKILNSNLFSVTYNTAFEKVIEACAKTIREKQEIGTWIHPEMIASYTQLHQMGYAHSVEVWQNNQLVGGLYGIKIGQVFCGESMFHTVANASKVAFIHMVKQYTQQGINLIDCQTHTQHLESLGANFIERTKFLEYLT